MNSFAALHYAGHLSLPVPKSSILRDVLRTKERNEMCRTPGPCNAFCMLGRVIYRSMKAAAMAPKLPTPGAKMPAAAAVAIGLPLAPGGGGV